MRLAIFGATGRIGSYLTELALNAGHEAVVLVRDPARLKLSHGRLRVVVGDAGDFDRVLEVVQGADAVLSTLGPRRNSPSDEEAHVIAVQNVIEAMRRTGVRRLVTVLGAAVDFPGDHKGLFDRLAGWCSGLPAIFTGRSGGNSSSSNQSPTLSGLPSAPRLLRRASPPAATGSALTGRLDVGSPPGM